jgi:ATP-dependent exoDNAse (exonuclease V) beta subunit
MLAGQSDCVEYFKTTNEIKISDFKTNESLKKPSYGKKLLYPLNHLEANLINKYNLQLSGYAYLLEKRGYKVIPEHQLLWINPATRKIEVFVVEYRKQDIENLIQHYTEPAF